MTHSRSNDKEDKVVKKVISEELQDGLKAAGMSVTKIHASLQMVLGHDLSLKETNVFGPNTQAK